MHANPAPQWTPITTEPDGLSESPFWHPQEQRLYWVDIPGKRIARVGDKVTCPKKGHGGTTVIVSGDPTMVIDGKPAARHGDKCACGATLLSAQAVSTAG